MNLIVLIGSILLGIALVLLVNPKKAYIQLLLAFSGAYLLAMTVLHLIPEAYESGTENIGVFILLGIIIQTILEFFSKGAEHGHVHAHGKQIPWLLMIGLFLHALIEGLPLGNAENNVLLWSIAIHKVPIAIVLFLFLRESILSKAQVYLIMLLFAFMSPIGVLLSSSPLIAVYHGPITAVVIGVFLHISTAILFESTQNHQFNFKKFVVVLIGFGLAFIGTYLAH